MAWRRATLSGAARPPALIRSIRSPAFVFFVSCFLCLRQGSGRAVLDSKGLPSTGRCSGRGRGRNLLFLAERAKGPPCPVLDAGRWSCHRRFVHTHTRRSCSRSTGALSRRDVCVRPNPLPAALPTKSSFICSRQSFFTSSTDQDASTSSAHSFAGQRFAAPVAKPKIVEVMARRIGGNALRLS